MLNFFHSVLNPISRGQMYAIQARLPSGQYAEIRESSLWLRTERASACVEAEKDSYLNFSDVRLLLCFFEKGIIHHGIKRPLQRLLKLEHLVRIIRQGYCIKIKGMLGHALSLTWYYLTDKRYLGL